MKKKLNPLITTLTALTRRKKITIQDRESLLQIAARLKDLANGMKREKFCDLCGEWEDKTLLLKEDNRSSRICKKCLLKFARGQVSLPRAPVKKTKKKISAPSTGKPVRKPISASPGKKTRNPVKKRTPGKKSFAPAKSRKPAAAVLTKAGELDPANVRSISAKVKIPEKIIKRIWKAKQSIIFPMDFQGTVDYVLSEGMHQIPREKIEHVLRSCGEG